MHRFHISLAVAGIALWLTFSSATGADSPEVPTIVNGRPVAPAALQPLPEQAESSRLMPLQSASILGAVCSDAGLRAQLSTDKAGCYREVRPGLTACRAQLQGQAPTGRTRASAGKPDIRVFRQQFRECLRDQLVARKAKEGAPLTLAPASVVDRVGSSDQ